MNKVILCVDDDAEDLDIFEEAISESRLPFTCVRALTDMDALAYLRSAIPDFIFLDINMPGVNGIELLKLLRKSPHLDDVPVVMLSTTVFNQNLLLQQGATACFSKPGNFLDLCIMLKEFFRLR